MEEAVNNEKKAEEAVNIDRFLDAEGRIIQLPRKQKPKYAVLEYLATKFEPDIVYTERQINDICSSWHTFDDYFLLRRELVDYHLLDRERNGSRYWRVKEKTAEGDTSKAAGGS